MMLINLLNKLDAKTLRRLHNTSKEYIYFNVSVFNVGVVIRPKCTNKYIDINYGNWNGYDQIHESEEIKYLIKEAIDYKIKSYE